MTCGGYPCGLARSLVRVPNGLDNWLVADLTLMGGSCILVLLEVARTSSKRLGFLTRLKAQNVSNNQERQSNSSSFKAV